MKFLVDAHLPKALSEFLIWKGFDSIHTIELPNKNKTTDKDILKICSEEERILITKDNDFLLSFLFSSQPKKLILIKIGNSSNKELLALFSANLTKIIQMIERSDFIEINKDVIIEK